MVGASVCSGEQHYLTACSRRMTRFIETAVRPRWNELPAALREALAVQLGEITSAEVQTGGFTPGLAARVRLAGGGRCFVKGIAVEHPLADKYRVEARTNTALPEVVPAPRLRWHGELAGWVVLVFDDIAGHPPELSPGASDVRHVVAALSDLAAALTPCPCEAVPRAEVELAEVVHGWRALAGQTPADLDGLPLRHLDELARLETAWLDAASGDTLVHGDVNRSNLLLDSGSRVWLLDWAQPVRGAAWLDVADLVPQLMQGGHSAAEAERAIADVPSWREQPPEVLTSYAVAFAGYWARSARLPSPPQVPHLRPYQARCAALALSWVAHRTGWVIR